MVNWKALARVLAIGLALAFGLGRALPDLQNSPASRVAELEAAWPNWLPGTEQCPADLMPGHQSAPLDFSIERCSQAFDRCLNGCRSGSANDCYSAALVTQKVKDGALTQALFQRSCALGVVSGCTNRAAHSDMKEDGNACAIRTYELACDQDDPWACSMIGLHLIRGTGVARDPARARRLLSKSCRYGPDDQACQVGRALLKEIEN